MTRNKVWEYTPDQDKGAWRLVVNDPDAPVIVHVASVMKANRQVVLGWTARGEIYEYR